jgi:hypothetical protein
MAGHGDVLPSMPQAPHRLHVAHQPNHRAPRPLVRATHAEPWSGAPHQMPHRRRCLLRHESASTSTAHLRPSLPYSILRKHQGDPVLLPDRPVDLWSELSPSFPITEPLSPLPAPPGEPPFSLTPQASSTRLPRAPGPLLTIPRRRQAENGQATAAPAWLPPWPSPCSGMGLVPNLTGPFGWARMKLTASATHVHNTPSLFSI